MVKQFESEQIRLMSKHDLTNDEIKAFIERLEQRTNPKPIVKKILKHKTEIVEIWKHFARYTIKFSTINEISFML